MPPKKMLKTDVSYVESIDCAKFLCPPFYLTKVTGIADTYNNSDVAIGIKGKLYFVYECVLQMVQCIADILSPDMGDLEASAQVCSDKEVFH